VGSLFQGKYLGFEGSFQLVSEPRTIRSSLTNRDSSLINLNCPKTLSNRLVPYMNGHSSSSYFCPANGALLLRWCFLAVVTFWFLLLLTNCGNNTIHATPPPSGSFGDANLTGTYVFSVAGSDISGNFVAIAGSFVADGKGSISSGIIEVNNSGRGALLAQPVTEGSYSVGVDGRPSGTAGLLKLRSSSLAYSFDYVLSSSTQGLITEFDSNGSGSGTLDLQSDVTQGSLAGQSFAFNLSGTFGSDSGFCGSNTSIVTVLPLSTVGAFSLDPNGNITSGLQDLNFNCISDSATNLQITSGAVSLSSNPGTATLVNPVITLHFDVFPVDATHLKFIETDPLPIMVGDAYLQVSSMPAGNNVFTLAGFDVVKGGPFTSSGILDADGSGNIRPDSVEDINDAGKASTIKGTISGTYTDLLQGRSTLSLTGFDNGSGGQVCSNCLFAAYPSIGGLQLLEIDDKGMTNGVAYSQTSTSIAPSLSLGMNLSGSNSSGAEDDIAEFVVNNGALNGLIDFNDQGLTSFGHRLSANYAADANVPGRGTVTSNSLNLVTYIVDGSDIAFVEVDQNQVGIGVLNSQTAGAVAHMVSMQPLRRAAFFPRVGFGAIKALPRR